jgi:putative transposase
MTAPAPLPGLRNPPCEIREITEEYLCHGNHPVRSVSETCTGCSLTGKPSENMTDDPKTHHRRSIRLKEYDYSSEGMYFVTVRTKKGECVFGEVVENEMRLSATGEIAQSCWLEIPEHFKNVKLAGRPYEMHTSCATSLGLRLPNHLHGILFLHEKPPALVRVEYIQPIREKHKNAFQHVVPKSVGSIIRSFKAAVTRQCPKEGQTVFQWHRDFYDHVHPVR